MLLAEEDRLSKQPRPSASHPHHASSPNVLFAANDTISASSSHSNNKGSHNKNRHNNNRGGGRGNRGRGRHNNNRFSHGNTYPPWSYGPPQWPYYYYHGGPPVLHSVPPHALYPSPSAPRPSSILGPYAPRPNSHAHVIQQAPSDATPTVIPTALAHAFNTKSLHDPTDSSWYMDTGATNHITAQPGTLSSIFNTSISPSVLVGNGSLTPVTKMGHGTISSPSRSLVLKNVLVCPSIIKNIISVRRFVTENQCAVEFDPFGFSVKDLLTRTNLLRCDSSG